MLLEDRGEGDHRLQLGWRCTLLVRAGSSSSPADLSGERNKAITAMSAFHFSGEIPALLARMGLRGSRHPGTMEQRQYDGEPGRQT